MFWFVFQTRMTQNSTTPGHGNYSCLCQFLQAVLEWICCSYNEWETVLRLLHDPLPGTQMHSGWSIKHFSETLSTVMKTKFNKQIINLKDHDFNQSKFTRKSVLMEGMRRRWYKRFDFEAYNSITWKVFKFGLM